MKLPSAELIETHENAIEMLLIIAQQRTQSRIV